MYDLGMSYYEKKCYKKMLSQDLQESENTSATERPTITIPLEFWFKNDEKDPPPIPLAAYRIVYPEDIEYW